MHGEDVVERTERFTLVSRQRRSASVADKMKPR
jgi:hypothetical protein